MRHRVEGRKLKRTASHRKALLQALATSLFRHKRIKTTEAKAKEARRFAEAIITRAKRAHLSEAAGTPDIHARRVVARDIHDAAVVRELFGEIAAKVAERPGGYTRVVKLGQRLGDGARVAVLELVDYNLDRDESAVRSRSKSAISRAERVARSRAKQAQKEAAAPKAAEAHAPVAEAEIVEAETPVETAPEENPAIEAAEHSEGGAEHSEGGAEQHEAGEESAEPTPGA
ncbi:MAG TPA: 50S ribosomal protein L17 [Candidatus Kapabacteria bacterium]|nr:50S ribosomal protein L17 [Candidatus Kapabacteria bacterium]